MTGRAGAIAAAGALVATAFVLPACAQQSCASYVDYDSPQQMYDAASVVVLGTLAPAAQELDINGTFTEAFQVSIERVFKGEAAASVPLIAATAPDPCAPPPTSLMSAGERVILFLNASEVDDVYVTITPYDGVIAFPVSDQPLPFDID